jgi:regulator of sigma D
MTQLENEIANMSNSVDELTERHLDVQNHLLEATANLLFLKKSKEEAAAGSTRRLKNKMLDLQVELAGKILFLV